MKNMGSQQEEWLRELLSCVKDKRLEQINGDFIKNAKYLKLLERQRVLYDRLRQVLPKESWPVLVEYADIRNDITALKEVYLYEAGFQDAAATAQMMLDWGKAKKLMKRYVDVPVWEEG